MDQLEDQLKNQLKHIQYERKDKHIEWIKNLSNVQKETKKKMKKKDRK